MLKEILVLWNDDQFSLSLNEPFGKSNLIYNCSEMESRLQFIKPEGIVLCGELCWNGKKFTDFHGFEILCQLRAEHRLECPIAICSFMPESWLRNKFPILDFPQHHPFIRLPASPEKFIEKIHKAEAADEPRLNDIIISYCDPKGRLIRLITHGKGFHQIIGNIKLNKDDEALWTNCNDDLALLKNYLLNRVLGSTILSLGNTLEVKLKEAIRTKNLDTLIDTKSIFNTLLNELTGTKDNSIVHLKKG